MAMDLDDRPPTERPSRAPVFRQRFVHFESIRNLLFGAVFLAVFLGAVWLFPRMIRPEAEVVADEAPAQATVVEVEDDPGAEGSGRYQPTTLADTHEWAGSRDETVLADPGARVAVVVLARRGADSASIQAVAVIQAAPLGATPAPEFDPDAIAAEPVQISEEQSGLVFSLPDDPALRMSWVTADAGRRMEMTTRGLPLVDLLTIAAGTVVIEPPPAAPGEIQAPPQITVVDRAGLEVLTDGPLPAGDRRRLSDNFFVTGDASGGVTIVHETPAVDFRPEAALTSPIARLVDVRGTTGVFDGTLRWKESDDLVLEVVAPGRSVDDLLDIAEGLAELTVDQLNRRRPPLRGDIEVEPGRTAPSPQVDPSEYGTRLGLDPDAVTAEPPLNTGVLVGPIRGVGRIEGTDVDLFHWDRGDGIYAECVGAVGASVEGIFCLDEDDAIGGGRVMGTIEMGDRAVAARRLHVVRVPSSAAMVVASVDGQLRWQAPVDGVAAFVVSDDDLLTIRVIAADGEELAQL